MPRDADRDVSAPEPACRRGWVLAKLLKHRWEPKRADEPVRWGETDEPEPAGDDTGRISGSPFRSEGDAASFIGGDVDA